MKRVAPLVLLLVLAVAAGVWFLGLGKTPEGPAPVGVEGDGSAMDGTSVDPESAKAPSLAAAGPGRARPKETRRGGSGIEGTVRRAGVPASARVDVRFVMEIPSAATRSMRWFMERMLVPPAALSAAVATTKAGDDGRFVVDGLAPGIYDVVAVAADGARGSAAATIPIDGARVQADPNLSTGTEALDGRVVHADGRPWKGTVVVDTSGERNDPLGFVMRGTPVVTAEDGRFKASGLDAGMVTVSAVETGAFRAMSKPVKIPYTGEYVLTVDAGMSLVDGRVVSDVDGSAVAGAAVTGGGQGTDIAFAVTKTASDADGRFKLMWSPSRGNGLFVQAPGFAPTWRQEIDPKKPLEIRLVRGARLSGRVTSEGEGRPVAGLAVSVQPMGRGNFGPFGVDPATTDADGRYALDDLPGGEAMAFAEGLGWLTKGLKEANEGGGAGYNPLAVSLKSGEAATADLVVIRGARVTGVVLDGSGAPVAGAVVAAGDDNSGMRMMRGPFGTSGPTAASAADGTFTLEGLSAGVPTVLTATAPGRATARSESVAPDDAQPPRVEIRFPADRFVTVTVLDDAAGTPLAGVRLRASLTDGNTSRAEAASWTSPADGVVKVGPLGAGKIRLSASLEDYVVVNGLLLADDEATTTLRMKRGLTIAGKVLNPDKTPAAGARVSAQSGGDGKGPSWYANDTCGSDGTFRLRGIPAGPVTVNANHSGDGTWSQGTLKTVAGAEDAVITLLAQGAAAGGKSIVAKVVDPDGKPIPQASVRYLQGNSSSSNYVREGKATLRLSEGATELTIEVTNATGSDGSPLPYGPARLEHVRADAGEVEIRLPPEMAITGFVRGPDGKGVRGVLVTAVPAGRETEGRYYGRWGGGQFPGARTDATGAFRLGGLGPDDVKLQVATPPEFAPIEAVSSRGGASGVEIALKAGVTAAVTVLDWQDKPVAGAVVAVSVQRTDANERSVRALDGSQQQRPVDAKGVAKLGGLDPAGPYVLTVTPPDARDDLSPSTTNPWAPRDDVIRLPRGYVVRGQVKDLLGKPITGVQLMRKTGENGWQGEQVAADGTFTIRRLGAGDVTLRAAMEGHGWSDVPGAPHDPSTAEVTVRAGTENVVLTIDPGVELVVRIENWPEERRWGQATLITDLPGGGQSTFGTQVDQNGVARWRGLKAGVAYTVWVAPQGDALSLYQRDLRAGGGEQKLRLVPGRSITGRITAPAGVDQLQVSLSGKGMWAQGKVEPDGRYEIPGLPEGLSWRVNAGGRKGDAWLNGQSAGEIPAGGTANIELKAP